MDNPIRSARRQAGKTIRDVATEVGVSERTVLRWEHGDAEPDGRTLLRLARVLGQRPETLIAEVA